MTPSQACIDLVRSFEGYAKLLIDGRCQAYLPTQHDVPTIGFGSTGPDIHMGLIWTREQAEKRFAEDLTKFSEKVTRAIGDNPTTQHQFDAMVSLAYNIGPGAFVKSTVLRKHCIGDYAGAAAAFALWNKQAGKVLDGLTRRRAAEAVLYGKANA